MTSGSTSNDRPVRVAFDSLSGDRGPAEVVAAAVRLVNSDPAAEAVLVGPDRPLSELLSAVTSDRSRIAVVNSDEGVPAGADPVAVVRARRGCSVRVCADLVSRGAADSTVSACPPSTALAAATFGLGRIHGVTRPALAVVISAPRGPVVLLDAGAGSEAGSTVDVLAQHALAGATYAAAVCGVPAPRVGLLSAGEGAADRDRGEAHGILSRLPVNYVGPVEGRDLAIGDRVDVVVADGFSGAVVLSALEGAALADVAAGMLLGVKGVSAVIRGDADDRSMAAAAALAVRAVRHDLVPRLAASADLLVQLRRQAMSAGVAT